MSHLFIRNPVSAEATSSLFTDEKIASARAQIIEWLNEAPISGSTTVLKCEMLSKVQEKLVHTDTELLEEFLSDVLAYSRDQAQDVRKAVVGLIEEICKLHITFMPSTIDTLSALLRDESPQVVKRVIQACAAVYKNTLQWLVTLADVSESTEQAWNTLCIIKAEILDMIDHDNDGIRTNAIKFLEGVVILQTYPDEDSVKKENDFSLERIPISMKIVRRRKLEDEANNIFDVLLKFHGASHISSVNLIACTGTLCIIAKMRPSFMSSVVDALKNLLAQLPPTLSDSQVSSVKKHLKMQLLNMLKNHASFEMHGTITPMLLDLGATNSEVAKATPKLDKHEHHRRAKRALENANEAAAAAKRQKIEADKKAAVAAKRQMEIDYDEVEDQIRRATIINETFLVESLKQVDQCVSLVIASMPQLPVPDAPQHFLTNYAPISTLTVAQIIQKIAMGIAPLITDKRIGPGMSAITKDPPMRVKVSLEEEKNIIQSARKDDDIPEVTTDAALDDESMETDEMAETATAEASGGTSAADVDARKEEATKRLRENMERAKTSGDASLLPKMKQRAKSLKLSEVTKPLSRIVKEKFLLDAVHRVLKAERKSVAGGAVVKRRKILTVLAATFTGSVREAIVGFIMEDVRARLDLAFSWLYEEYSLLQGFTRHSYIKSEQKPDFAYNKLLGELISNVIDTTDPNLDKATLLHKIYMQAPLISDEAFAQLVSLCELTDLSDCALKLIRDLIINRPPKKLQFLNVLLTYAMHDNATVRDKSIEQILILYSRHNIQVHQIEAHALLWLGFLEQTTPPQNIFTTELGRPESISVWNESLTRACVSLFFALLPYRESLINNLCEIYVSTSSEMKRTILRSIEPPIKAMGPESAELLQLIENCPKGTETLITRIIYILTDKAAINKELVNRVRELYTTKVADVRLLIPVINGLSKSEILTALPKLLKLNEVVVKEVFSRLLAIGKHADQQVLPISATELMVALHTIDATKVELKYSVKATSLCLTEKDCYTQDVLAIVLQQLFDVHPVPTLLMRTALQTLTLYPRLAAFVANLLHRLIPKQVWKQKVIWDGFLKCCQRLRPHSLPVLLMLPPQQLIDALNTCPELRQPLIEAAEEIAGTQGGSVSKLTMEILRGNTQDLFITEVSGLPDYGVIIPPQKIKQELPDEMAEMMVGGQQPLPPGEE